MRKVLTVLAVVVVLVLIGIGIMQWQRPTGEGPLPPIVEPPTDEQPEWCPDVEVVAAAGTWESSADDDPINPQANPASFMLTITQPLQERYDPDEVKVWTVPYAAQFRSIHAQHEMSYDDSRQQGTDRVRAEMGQMHSQCPQTDFVLTGFSQGAVILGDIASQIGNGQGVVPADRVRGVALIADGRREPGVGQVPGNPVAGVGAEVALAPLNLLIQPVVPGATMRGPREGGFGELDGRVQDICAPEDAICDAPVNVGNAVARAEALAAANGVHAMYATNPNVIPGTTANAWVVDWASQLIDESTGPAGLPEAVPGLG